MSRGSVDEQLLAHLEVLSLLERVLELLHKRDVVELRHLELVLHGPDDLHDDAVADLLRLQLLEQKEQVVLAEVTAVLDDLLDQLVDVRDARGRLDLGEGLLV